ncbi:transcription factor MYC2 [Striga asiatica]|uniref:Transcription factor MYC2 n=1 Tax=Striga asiatica TaxID=4170 RepID=A0A5A7PEE5_STRAF|nr:transcription factor MYC2 [Striga asiatica]
MIIDYLLSTSTQPPANMNYIWPAAVPAATDVGASMADAFISSSASDLASLCPSSSAAGDHHQTQPTFLSHETLQRRLLTLIEGARESWTYATFWQSSKGVIPLRAGAQEAGAPELSSLFSGAQPAAGFDYSVDEEVTDIEGMNSID